MDIAIIGYGRMGKEVEDLALQRGHTIVAKIDNDEDWHMQHERLIKANVAIEFSLPGQAAGNILRCFEAGVPVVSGTTGWLHRYDEVSKVCLEGNHAFFYASNFSPGMNVMFELNRKLASLMNKQDYQIRIEEIHHTAKKDAPSGTAITLANDIIRDHPIKNSWVNKKAESEEELEITSVRKDNVPGTHVITYESDIDSLEIKHTAHSRKGFALGALLAAEWLQGRKGIFGMKDLLYDQA